MKGENIRNRYLNINVENLDKRVNGVHLSAWIDLPQEHSKLLQKLKDLEIANLNNTDSYRIIGYSTSISNLSDHLGQHENINELNNLATTIDKINEKDFIIFESALCLPNGALETNELIQLTKSLDKYALSEDIKDGIVNLF